MRSDFHISREKLVRDELALQRRLGAARRAASTLMPTVHRTGLAVKPARGAPGASLPCAPSIILRGLTEVAGSIL